jgi:hypothetical protein
MSKTRLVIDLETQGLGPSPTILGVAWSFLKRRDGKPVRPENRDIKGGIVEYCNIAVQQLLKYVALLG